MMNTKKVYLYTINKELIKVFNNTEECADYFGYDRTYIYHNIKYCKKIWNKKERKWYIINRDLFLPVGQQQDY